MHLDANLCTLEGMTTTLIPTWTLGDRMAKARKAAGYDTPGEMAARLGVHRNTVSNWEHGRVDVPPTAIIAWASVTSVPQWWLLGDGEPTDDAVTGGYPPTWPVTALAA